MKKVLFVLSLLLCSTLFISAQTPLSFSKVINADGITSKQLYDRLEAYLMNNFNNSDKSMKVKDDKEILLNTYFVYVSQKHNLGSINKGLITYTLYCSCSDGKFNIEMKNFSHQSNRDGQFGVDDFGVLYSDLQNPKIKILFASKKWKAEVYKDMKEKASIEFETVCKKLEEVAKNPIITPIKQNSSIVVSNLNNNIRQVYDKGLYKEMAVSDSAKIRYYNLNKATIDKKISDLNRRSQDFRIGTMAFGAGCIGTIIAAGLIDNKKYDAIDSKGKNADEISKKRENDRKTKKTLYWISAGCAGAAIICESLSIAYRNKALNIMANAQGISVQISLWK